jgi:tetratricopeptide (TPR) repeat protein
MSRLAGYAALGLTLCTAAGLCAGAPWPAQASAQKEAYEVREEADRLYDQGRFDDARPLYLQVRSRFPEDAELLEKLGWCFSKGQHPDLARAIQYWLISLQFQKSETLQVEVARAYVQRNRWNDAVKTMLQLTREHTDHAEHWRELAQMAVQNGKDQDAIKWYQAYLDRRAGDTEARLEMADLLFRTKQYLEALNAYNMVLQTDPRNEAAHAGVDRVNAATAPQKRRGSR